MQPWTTQAPWNFQQIVVSLFRPFAWLLRVADSFVVKSVQRAILGKGAVPNTLHLILSWPRILKKEKWFENLDLVHYDKLGRIIEHALQSSAEEFKNFIAQLPPECILLILRKITNPSPLLSSGAIPDLPRVLRALSLEELGRLLNAVSAESHELEAALAQMSSAHLFAAMSTVPTPGAVLSHLSLSFLTKLAGTCEAMHRNVLAKHLSPARLVSILWENEEDCCAWACSLEDDELGAAIVNCRGETMGSEEFEAACRKIAEAQQSTSGPSRSPALAVQPKAASGPVLAKAAPSGLKATVRPSGLGPLPPLASHDAFRAVVQKIVEQPARAASLTKLPASPQSGDSIALRKKARFAPVPSQGPVCGVIEEDDEQQEELRLPSSEEEDADEEGEDPASRRSRQKRTTPKAAVRSNEDEEVEQPAPNRRPRKRMKSAPVDDSHDDDDGDKDEEEEEPVPKRRRRKMAKSAPTVEDDDEDEDDDENNKDEDSGHQGDEDAGDYERGDLPLPPHVRPPNTTRFTWPPADRWHEIPLDLEELCKKAERLAKAAGIVSLTEAKKQELQAAHGPSLEAKLKATPGFMPWIPLPWQQEMRQEGGFR